MLIKIFTLTNVKEKILMTKGYLFFKKIKNKNKEILNQLFLNQLF